jgi:hypothetical protein
MHLKRFRLDFIDGWDQPKNIFLNAKDSKNPLSFLLSAVVDQELENVFVSGLKFGRVNIEQNNWLSFLLKKLREEGLPIQYPLTITVEFKKFEDANFNSIVYDNEIIDIANFRNNPNYWYLTAADRTYLNLHVQTSYLRKFGISNQKILSDLEFLKRSAKTAPYIDDNKIYRMDLMHYYFYRHILSNCPVSFPYQVVEIGGGYGGLARIFTTFENPPLAYTIIDIPRSIELQKKYLEMEAENYAGYNFINATFGFSAPYRETNYLTIGIATHSLSELDPKQINDYLENVILNFDFFYLAMQLNFGFNGLSNLWIVHRLQQTHKIVSINISDRGLVLHALFQKRKSI